MSAPKFTPGPWFWALDTKNQPTALMRSGSGDWVATPQADVGDYGLSINCYVDVSDADAALIAAAPELFEALRNTLALARLKFGNLDADANEIMRQADAALSKANPQPKPEES